MAYTKNQYKRKIRDMKYQELIKEFNDLNLTLLKARTESARSGNPYDKGQWPVKLIKWKFKIVNQELHNKVRKLQ